MCYMSLTLWHPSSLHQSSCQICCLWSTWSVLPSLCISSQARYLPEWHLVRGHHFLPVENWAKASMATNCADVWPDDALVPAKFLLLTMGNDAEEGTGITTLQLEWPITLMLWMLIWYNWDAIATVRHRYYMTVTATLTFHCTLELVMRKQCSKQLASTSVPGWST